MTESVIVVGTRVQYTASGGAAPLRKLIGMCGTVLSRSFIGVGVSVHWDNGDTSCHSIGYLTPLPTPVDELPPAPYSVRYYPNSAQPHVHITVEQYKDSAGSFVAVDSVYNGSCVSQYLEPDTALQLAHDLMRMALKLKREQRG